MLWLTNANNFGLGLFSKPLRFQFWVSTSWCTADIHMVVFWLQWQPTTYMWKAFFRNIKSHWESHCFKITRIFLWLMDLTISTRTTRTPAFWGYPPPPHDYPYYWPVRFESQVHTIDQFISDPKSKQGESLKIRKVCEKLKFYNFVKNLTRDTPSNGSDYLWQIWK